LSKRRNAQAAVEKEIVAGKAAFRNEAEPMLTSNAVPIRPERLMGDLSSLLTPNMQIVTDASYSSIWAMNYLNASFAGQRFLTGRGLAGLGWGLPAALGAKVAHPEREVVCIAGDGAFAHVWSELETAVRMKLKVIQIVLNNQILGYQWHAEEVMYGDHTDACQCEPVDHAAIARACGCEGVRVEDPADFKPALVRALAGSKTTVIDVMIDPRAYPPLTLYEGKIAYRVT